MLTLRLAIAYFQRRKVRTVLTVLSVAVAVAVLVAIRGLNGSIDFVNGQMAGLMGGVAQLEIKAPLSGMSQSHVQQVQSTDGVKYAVPFIESSTQLQEYPAAVSVLGILPGEDQKIRSYKLARGRMPAAGQQEIVLPERLLVECSADLGNTLHLQGQQGMEEYRIVGVLADSGVALLNDGQVICMPLDTAQAAFGLADKVTCISVVIKDSFHLDTVKASLVQQLGPSVEVRSPQDRRNDLDTVLAGVQAMYNVSGIFGLFLALFVVCNTLAMAVVEQQNEIGILRALGWRKMDTGRLIVFQALLIGIIGSTFGLPLGKLLGEALLLTVAPALQDYVKIILSSVHLLPVDYLMIWAAGVATCLVSSYFPAQRAARVPPFEAIAAGYHKEETGYTAGRITIGMFFVITATLFTVFSDDISLAITAGSLSYLVAAAILLPPLLVGTLRIVEYLGNNLFGLPGKLGVHSFRNAPRRAMITGMPLLLGFIVSFGVVSTVYTFSHSLQQWVQEWVVPDIVISTGGLGSRIANQLSLPENLLLRVHAISGVNGVVGLRYFSVNWQGKNITVCSLDVDEWRKIATPHMVEPGTQAALDGLAQKSGVWISENISLKHGLRTGQKVVLPTQLGAREFTVQGIFKDYTDQQGSIIMNRKDYIEFWRDHSVDYVEASVTPGTSVNKVRDLLEQDLNKDYKLKVDSAATFQGGLTKMMNDVMDICNLVVLVSLLVGAVAIANTLLISVLERTREIGTLRSLGMQRGQIRQIFIFEVGALLLASGLLAIPVSIGAYEITMSMVQRIIGWIYYPYIPWTTLIMIILAMVSTAWLSALFPAWLGSRVNPAEALHCE